MLEIGLSHSAVPVLLYPKRSADVPGSLPQATTFSCNVSLKATEERIRIGGVVAVWQASLKLFETVTQKAEDWEPLETIVVPLHDEDFSLAEGEEKHYSFDINIPAHLSVSRTTPWERIAHVVYVFAISPSPMYSVVPALRDKADEVEPEPAQDKPKGFMKSLRRLSLGSRSSGSSDKGKGKKKAEGPSNDWSEPPFPKLSSPFVAEYHKEIIVTASSDEPGEVLQLLVDKRVNLVGLGEMKLHAGSDMCIIGSGFHNCVRFWNLNPLATIHCYRITLEQRMISADRREVWVDRFKLYELGRSQLWDHTATPTEYIWRGSALLAKDHANNPKAKITPSDGIHLTCAPRLPSSVVNGRPTWLGFDPSLSSTDSTLEFSIWWSVYGEDVAGNRLDPPREGDMRITNIKSKPNIGTCSFSFVNVIAPTYSLQPVAQTDREGCMEPFARGTEPTSVLVKAESWIEADGKRVRNPQQYDEKAFSLLQHQVDTEGTCACFYAEAYDTSKPDPRAAQVVDGILDLAKIQPVRGTDADRFRARTERQEKWMHENRKKRRAVPGFLHMLGSACSCEEEEVEAVPDGVKA